MQLATHFSGIFIDSTYGTSQALLVASISALCSIVIVLNNLLQ